MVDDSESSDRFCESRNNWELVSLEKTDHVSEEASSSSSGFNEPSFYDNKFINKDSFAVASMKPPYPDQQHTGDINNVSPRPENVEPPPSTCQHLDWIEPSKPIQSCIIGTSEDEDSSSRSCSGDSREGSAEHLLKEKDAITSTGFDRDSYICEYAAVLHDVPMDVIQESNVEPSEETDDVCSGQHGGNALLRHCLAIRVKTNKYLLFNYTSCSCYRVVARWKWMAAHSTSISKVQVLVLPKWKGLACKQNTNIQQKTCRLSASFHLVY